MRRTISSLLKLAGGAALGYAVYGAIVLGSVLLRAERIHYFDGEELLARLVAPVGGLYFYVFGGWQDFPAWLRRQDFLAYCLAICGAVFAFLYKRKSG
jgi:hypothetical protein